MNYNNRTKSIELVETDYPFLYEVKLNLPFESRCIGLLDIRDDGTFTTERKFQHLLRIKNALGINQELLTRLDISYKWIVIYYERQELVTSRKYFLAKGKAIQFSSQGFEPQIFLPLSEFGIEKVRLFEATNFIQGDLFGEAI